MDDFSSACPYHILLDGHLRIVHCGDNIRSLAIVDIVKDTPLKAIGTIVHPVIQQTVENILSFINSVFLLAMHKRSGDRPFILKGN